MAIEMTSKQTWLERKNAIDNARLFVGIIIGYSFFHTFCLFLITGSPRHIASMNILSECARQSQHCILLSVQSPEPTFFMYSILDYLLKFSTTNREIPPTIFIFTYKHTIV